MPQSSKPLYRFGPYQLDPAEHQVLHGNSPIFLTPKQFETLLVLVENAGHLLQKDDLMKRLWPESFVEEGTLAKNVSALRKILGLLPDGGDYIETVPKSGYRFAAPVEKVQASEVAMAPPAVTARPGMSAVQKEWFRGFLLSGIVVAIVALGILIWKQPPKPQTPPPARAMLVVLPFENLSGDKEQEYFSDGFTEELISQLGSLNSEELGIIARTTSMQFRSTKKSVTEIGRELNVEYVIEGSVRREGQRVRITAQLVRAGDQSHLWAESFERDSAATLPVQVSVARDVAEQIRRRLAPSSRNDFAETIPVNREAYELHLRGRFFWNKRSEDGFRKAIASFEQAIALAPNYAPAYAGLADCYNLLDEYSIRPSADSFPKAKAAATKALELDASLPDAHASLAYATMYYDRDWDSAEQKFRKAIELNPNQATSRQWYGEFLVARGRFSEASAEIQKALQVDPLSLVVNSALAFSYLYGRQPELAIQQYKKVIEMEPEFVVGHYGLGWALVQKGDLSGAEKEFQKAIQILGGETDAIASLGYVAAIRKDKAAADRVIARLLALSKRRYVSPVNVAAVYAALGKNEEATHWLDKAMQERYGWLIYLKVDPRFDTLRNDPRFVRLSQQLKL